MIIIPLGHFGSTSKKSKHVTFLGPPILIHLDDLGCASPLSKWFIIPYITHIIPYIYIYIHQLCIPYINGDILHTQLKLIAGQVQVCRIPLVVLGLLRKIGQRNGWKTWEAHGSPCRARKSIDTQLNDLDSELKMR